jgi:hypothetical protein
LMQRASPCRQTKRQATSSSCSHGALLAQ